MVNDIQNKIIIVGGGLIGELLHMMLKSKGFEINHFKTELLRYRHLLSIG